MGRTNGLPILAIASLFKYELARGPFRQSVLARDC
jgi:hypothetical protein